MLVAVDKRGSISLPAALRKELGLESGTYLDLQVHEGGKLVLQPVAVSPTIRLSAEALTKLQEARESGTGELPDWLRDEMRRAQAETE